MKTITITSEKEAIAFEKKYYIIEGNNGNHSGYNREWSINTLGYSTKKEALKVYRDMVNENDDIKHGLTPVRIVTAQDLIEIYESQERIGLFECLHVKKKD
jgi:hypothetical protein